MSFIEELKGYLQHVRDTQGGQAGPSPFVPEVSWIRSELIQLFERVESAQPHVPPESLKFVFEEWTRKNRVDSFAKNLAILLQHSFLSGAPQPLIEEHLRLAMARRLGLHAPIASHTRAFELDRLSQIAWSSRSMLTPLDNSILDYALEIRAIRREGHRSEVGPIGEVLLSLTGRDAIQWLLHVEVTQSMGPLDDWRLSRDTAEYLLVNPENIRDPAYWILYPAAYSLRTLRRLEGLGLLVIVEEFDEVHGTAYTGYKLLNEGRRAFEALLLPDDSPFSVLAATLSQDESLAALEQQGSKVWSEANFSSSAIATARQARMVVHEIRNALVPAQIALGSLYTALVGSQSEAELARFRPRIDPGIDRALKFVTDLLKTTELAARAPEAFDLLRSLADAVSSLATPLRIHLQGSTDLPSLSGYRERFVLAIVNLLRNAEQAGAQQVSIESVLEANNRNILLTVDDDGSGVPPADRERIFQRGISLRPGGAGEGLALVKEVVEIELHGKIACVDKPGGGARFRMRLPVAERTPR
ncbi:sensor histidine kinase [Corallococcus llansteffanensis]|uniref:histidine kinase n=1 Tax=Corallococcus llansteffanensis TaxID=2316731 RepID=A0A3A8PZ82_9BACT|nr:HAMP domain-containing sensor histidine kinase [Corallococcus llansteffanensis]RKH61789.1 sensor histidine kinase [Corallococcus llansteffanensis]